MKAQLEAEIAVNPGAKRDDVPQALLGHLEQLSFVTHEDCAAFSQDFGTLIDVEDLFLAVSTRWKFPPPGWTAGSPALRISNGSAAVW